MSSDRVPMNKVAGTKVSFALCSSVVRSNCDERSPIVVADDSFHSYLQHPYCRYRLDERSMINLGMSWPKKKIIIK